MAGEIREPSIDANIKFPGEKTPTFETPDARPSIAHPVKIEAGMLHSPVEGKSAPTPDQQLAAFKRIFDFTTRELPFDLQAIYDEYWQYANFVELSQDDNATRELRKAVVDKLKNDIKIDPVKDRVVRTILAKFTLDDLKALGADKIE